MTTHHHKNGIRIGICDWTLNMQGESRGFEKCKELGFDGVQVSLNVNDPYKSLSFINVDHYLENSKKYNIEICSSAAVNFLKQPLALSVDPEKIFGEYFNLLNKIGVNIILVPFFGRGDINSKASLLSGFMKKMRKIPPQEYMYRKTIDTMKKIARLAEESQVTVGLETLLHANETRKMVDEIGSSSIKVFYDAGNSHEMGYDILEEIGILGPDYICQVHLKEKYNVLGGGKINYDKIMQKLFDMDYDGWFVIEMSSNILKGLRKSMLSNVVFLNRIANQVN